MEVIPLTFLPKDAHRLSAYFHLSVKSGIAGSLGLAVLLLGFEPEARAATKTWDGGAGTTAWGTANNWNANGVPGSADDVLFDNSSVATLPTSVSLGGSQAANSLSFSTGDTFSLVDGSGNRTLTLTSGNITRSGSGTQSLAFNTLALSASGTWDIGGTGTFTVSSKVTGTGFGITKTGAGLLVLSGANTYTGGTAFNAGTVNAGSSGALGSSGTLSFGGGTLQYSASNTTDYSSRFSTAASQAYNIDTNGQSVTLATALTSSGGSLAKSGTGTLTLSGTNTYTAGTTLSAGTLKASNTSAFGTTAGTLTLGGGTLDLATNTSISAYNTNVTASSTIASDKATAASAGITHTLGTLAIGTSTLTINSGANVSANSAYGVAFGATTISGDATVSVANNGTATGTLTLGALTNGGSGSLTKTGAGTLAFSSTGNFNANLTLTAGTLALNGTNQTFGTLNVTGNSVIDFAGGNSVLTITSLVISAGVTLTITNWTDSLDYFYATNDPGSTTLAQVVFNPPTYTSANTHWVSVGGQITPVPEPATYGALLLGMGLAFVLWRRRGGPSA
jgi:autotransporter-associated beta strand protein